MDPAFGGEAVLQRIEPGARLAVAPLRRRLSRTALRSTTSLTSSSDDDVAFFFEDNTGRPGLSVVVLGAVIAVVAALGWWRPRLRPAAIGLIGLASIVALVVFFALGAVLLRRVDVERGSARARAAG